MRIDYLLICIFVPVIISGWLTRVSKNNLSKHELILLSKNALYVFLIFRLLYWIGFGVLICAFILALLQTGSGGEQTRGIIARSLTTGDGTANFLLSQMSIYFLPAIFISLFVSVIALAIIGRKVVTLLPQESKPGREFTRFRFTFVIMACSLIAPPLAFGSLLLL